METAPAGNGGAELTVLACEETDTSTCYELLTDMFKTTERQVLVKTKLK